MGKEKSLKIGLVSEYNESTKTGKIHKYRGGTIEFTEKHISNGIIIRKGNIVGYYIEETIEHDYDENTFCILDSEIVSLNLADNMTTQLVNNRGRMCAIEWALVKKGNQEIFLNENENEIKHLIQFYSDIEKHVEKTEIEELINCYSVGINSFGRNKPGGDDSFSVYLSGGIVNDEYKMDTFINSILPKVDIQKHRDFGFVPWRSMEKEFYDDTQNVTKLKREAEDIERIHKENARKLYNKAKHLTELKHYYLNKIQKILSKNFNENEDLIKRGWKSDQ